MPNATYSIDFVSGGDEYVVFTGTSIITTATDWFVANDWPDYPEASYLLKSSQYYWDDIQGQWVESLSGVDGENQLDISFSDINVANDTITLDSTFVHGDVIRVSSGTGSLDSSTEYYLLDQGSNVFKLSEEAGGSVVDITSQGTGTHTIHRVNNRALMSRFSYGTNDSWRYNFDISTDTIPADSSTDIQFYALAGIVPSSPTTYGDVSYSWRNVVVKIEDPATASGNSITYELEQTGTYSVKQALIPSYFGIVTGKHHRR